MPPQRLPPGLDVIIPYPRLDFTILFRYSSKFCSTNPQACRGVSKKEKSKILLKSPSSESEGKMVPLKESGTAFEQG